MTQSNQTDKPKNEREELEKAISKHSNTGDLSGEIYPAYNLYDRIWHWHIESQKRLLKEIIESAKDETFGTYDYDLIAELVFLKLQFLLDEEKENK